MISWKFKKLFLIVLLPTFFSGLVLAGVDEAVNPIRSLELQQSLRSMNSFPAKDAAKKPPADEKSKPEQEQQKQLQQAVKPVSATEVNETTVSYKPLDPFAKLQQNGQQELRAWIHSKDEERIGLVNNVQSQFNSELAYIRQIAMQEGAAKTVNAIDKVVAERKKRMDTVVQRIKEVRLQQGSQNQQQTGLLNRLGGMRSNESARGVRGRTSRLQTQQGQNSRFNRQQGSTRGLQQNQRSGEQSQRTPQTQSTQQKSSTNKQQQKKHRSRFEELFKKAMQDDK